MRAASLLPLLACALASPLVVHEKRNELTSHDWVKLVKLDPAAVIPLRIGLKQSNLELGDGWLMDIADPTSPNYGKHWTAEEVIDAFKPSHETVKTVHDWLNNAGIDSVRHTLSESLSWLEVEVTAKEAKALMDADYHIFTHKETDTRHIACDSYSVPEHVQSHIDFISPGIHFDAKIRGDEHEEYDEQGNKLAKRWGGPWWPGHHHWGPGPRPHYPPWHPHPSNANICNDSFVTPYCIRTLYGVPTDLTPAEGNSVGIVEYTPESFLQSDLNLFFSRYEPPAVGEAPKFDSIDGGFLYRNYNLTTSFEYLGEPSLDLQYSMALLYPQVSYTIDRTGYELIAEKDVVLYQVGDLAEAANTSFNNFLDAIDKSYCTYDGGDVPGLDAVYPDPYPGPHSYKGQPDCGTYAPAKVISTSYAYPEIGLPASYERRQCHEYMKLGLMGVTFAYSSGDYGVTFGGQCLGSNGQLNNGSSGIFLPTFPSTCPYVLSVGGTQIANFTNNVVQQIEAGKQVEVAMELYLNSQGLIYYDVPPNANTKGQTIFSSSGGYSNVFTLPSYQDTAVGSYNKNYRPSYPGQYNAGNARGFPDISSNGAWLSIVVDGQFSQVFGTSCSAPTVAALLGLINGERLKQGKKTVGFVNPTFYAHPEIFNDVTIGRNPGCGTNGFSAVPGWDPITGLGTPNFPKMLDLFKSLP